MKINIYILNNELGKAKRNIMQAEECEGGNER